MTARTPPANIDPVMVEPVLQKTGSDCAIACLATICEVSYHRASLAARRIVRDPHKQGLWTTQILRAAARLKRRLRKTPATDLDGKTGILTVNLAGGGGHAVVLFEGVVFNPADGLLCSLDTYLTNRRATVAELLVRTP